MVHIAKISVCFWHLAF